MYFSVYMCIFTLCFILLLQILFVAALDIKTRDVPTVSTINSLLSQYCKAMHFFANFYVGGGGRQLFALPPLSHGQRPALILSVCVQTQLSSLLCLPHSTTFFSHCHKWHDFREKKLNIKCVLISTTAFVWNISRSKKNWARYGQKWILVFT
jgi:hypothetical protein